MFKHAIQSLTEHVSGRDVLDALGVVFGIIGTSFLAMMLYHLLVAVNP